MYGTRDAGSIWEDVYTETLVAMGFVQGKASSCCFWHPTWQIRVVVHGDDLTALGTPSSLDLYEAALRKSFEIKIRGRLGEHATRRLGEQATRQLSWGMFMIIKNFWKVVQS